LHGINVAGGVAGRRVLVSGSGAIGLLAVAGALALGATEVVSTDVLPGPLERARSLGVHGTVQVGVDEIPAQGFDVVLECMGIHAAISTALCGGPTGR
jgi:L-idonate 5-dehydrogenase